MKFYHCNLPDVGDPADQDPDWLEGRERRWQHVENRVILSLFDHSGAWSRPWLEAGYAVLAFDIKQHQGQGLAWQHSVGDFNAEYLTAELGLSDVYGILAAPPCTHFASSGAQYWKAKDADGRTDEMLELVRQVIRTVDLFAPKFWAMENPVGRLPKLLPDLGRPWYWQPCDYGDPWTKKTGLWGRFNKNLRQTPVEPLESWGMRLGGSSEATKERRSVTPQGFARAFFAANHF